MGLLDVFTPVQKRWQIGIELDTKETTGSPPSGRRDAILNLIKAWHNNAELLEVRYCGRRITAAQMHDFITDAVMARSLLTLCERRGLDPEKVMFSPEYAGEAARATLNDLPDKLRLPREEVEEILTRRSVKYPHAIFSQEEP